MSNRLKSWVQVDDGVGDRVVVKNDDVIQKVEKGGRWWGSGSLGGREGGGGEWLKMGIGWKCEKLGVVEMVVRGELGWGVEKVEGGEKLGGGCKGGG